MYVTVLCYVCHSEAHSATELMSCCNKSVSFVVPFNFVCKQCSHLQKVLYCCYLHDLASHLYKKGRVGDPEQSLNCGTPEVTGIKDEQALLRTTCWDLFSRNLLIHWCTLPCVPQLIQ